MSCSMVGSIWAHPHSRGENSDAGAPHQRARGSSPLTRGKHKPVDGRADARGLIPTHAGKTFSARASSASMRAHPHSRGENERRHRSVTSRSGSSPLTRGKPAYSFQARGRWRLIPTHAGKTRHHIHEVIERRAHPHSRGENFGQKANDPGAKGSSPLTRGKHAVSAAVLQVGGLIPTHAGKTPTSATAASTATAHPHSRGENPSFEKATPRARRLIPTHAGKT